VAAIPWCSPDGLGSDDVDILACLLIDDGGLLSKLFIG